MYGYIDVTSKMLYEPMLYIFGNPISLSIILAIGLILSTLISFLIFRKRKPWRVAASRKWLEKFRSNKNNYSPMQRFAYIRKVDHFLWEDILMSCFEERGYPITRTKMTRDGGSDGFVTINGKLIVIQAKRYKGNIAKAHVLELERLIIRNKAFDKGLFIHTGKSSGPILDYFKSSDHIELLSGVDSILRFLDGDRISMFGASLNSPKLQ